MNSRIILAMNSKYLNEIFQYNATKNFIKRDSYAKKFRVNAKNYVKSKSLILDKTFIKIKKYLV